MQEKDLTCDGAMTDPKGDRSLALHKQADPDLFLRILEERKDGIVVRGARAHQTGAVNSHEIIAMPWGGLPASAFTAVLSIILTFVIKGLMGPVFSDMNSALTYGYMGVAWSFFIPLFFGIGFEKPYLWVGQKTPGTRDDVD